MTPNLQAMTVVFGTTACNCDCRFCCSALTCPMGVTEKFRGFNEIALLRMTGIAARLHCFSAVITGKGEPTLFEQDLSHLIQTLGALKVPLVELQTNGVRLPKLEDLIHAWYMNGLAWISISLVSWDDKENKAVMQPRVTRPSTSEMVKFARRGGVKVRLNCIMHKDGVDSFDKVMRLREFATDIGAHHVTIRPVNRPTNLRDDSNLEKAQWIDNHKVPEEALLEIRAKLREISTKTRGLAHGAEVYSVRRAPGKPEENLCFSNCFLTDEERTALEDDTIRQLIMFPDGTVTTDWDHEGSSIL